MVYLHLLYSIRNWVITSHRSWEYQLGFDSFGHFTNHLLSSIRSVSIYATLKWLWGITCFSTEQDYFLCSKLKNYSYSLHIPWHKWWGQRTTWRNQTRVIGLGRKFLYLLLSISGPRLLFQQCSCYFSMYISQLGMLLKYSFCSSGRCSDSVFSPGPWQCTWCILGQTLKHWIISQPKLLRMAVYHPSPKLMPSNFKT